MSHDGTGFTPAWNSHVAALACVCRATGRNWAEADVAGFTGTAFRTTLCAQATPPGLYRTWSCAHYFSEWLGSLGMACNISWSRAGAPGLEHWLAGAGGSIEQSLALGFSVIYWDNHVFSVITAVGQEGFVTGGIMESAIHPALLDHESAAGFSGRVQRGGNQDLLLRLDQDELINEFNSDVFFACPTAVHDVDEKKLLAGGIRRAARELQGQLEYPRNYAEPGLVLDAQFGLQAFSRLIEELKSRTVHHFGLVQFIQSQAEARRWGSEFLAGAADSLPGKFRARLSQAAQFLERNNSVWRDLAAGWGCPVSYDEQMNGVMLLRCAEALYQIHRTEQTAARLVGSVADELAH